jgi:hypothetical protein
MMASSFVAASCDYPGDPNEQGMTDIMNSFEIRAHEEKKDYE